MMNDTNSLLPDRLQEIVEDFRLCEGKEKLELLLQFSEKMPPLPDWLQSSRGSMEQVHECMTPVFVHAEIKSGGMEFYFDAPAESPSVRGYAALLSEGVKGAAPQAIIAIPPRLLLRDGVAGSAQRPAAERHEGDPGSHQAAGTERNGQGLTLCCLPGTLRALATKADRADWCDPLIVSDQVKKTDS